jgi:hypothetical protein
VGEKQPSARIDDLKAEGIDANFAAPVCRPVQCKSGRFPNFRALEDLSDAGNCFAGSCAWASIGSDTAGKGSQSGQFQSLGSFGYTNVPADSQSR